MHAHKLTLQKKIKAQMHRHCCQQPQHTLSTGSINPINGLLLCGFSHPIYLAHLLQINVGKKSKKTNLLYSANTLTFHQRPWHLPNIYLTLPNHQSFTLDKLTLPPPPLTSCWGPAQLQPASLTPLRFHLMKQLLASSSPLRLCFLQAQNHCWHLTLGRCCLVSYSATVIFSLSPP